MRTWAASALLAAGLCARASANPPSPRLAEASAAVRAGDRKKALELLSAVRADKPSSEDRENAALLYAELKDYAAAQAMMDALIRESPEDAHLRHNLATILARAGDRGETLAALAEARARHPDAVYRQRMAFLYQDFKEYGPARELLDGLIAESPADLSVRLDRASLAAQSGEGPEALKQLAAAEKLKPGPGDRRRMALLFQDLREFERARELLDALIKEAPTDPGLRLDLAALALRSGDRPAALAALAAARERGPGVDQRRRIASAYQELREFDETRSVLAGLVRDAPRDATALLELAALDTRRGERAPALESLAAAAKLEPDLQERQRMALLYEDLKEFKTARRMIDALIAEQPRDPQLRLDRAFFAADAGDRAAALAALAETLDRAPDPDDRRRMAQLYDRLDEHGAARARFDEAGKKTR
jgi:predicted Zn-dependent protease